MSVTYFFENNGGAEQLWTSDGSAGGAQLVKTFATTSISELTTIGARAYFVVDDGIHGAELWTSDGTASGTGLVKDIFPGAIASNPKNLTNVDGTLFFTANDSVHGNELWKTDGTAAGTVLVDDAVPGATSSLPRNPTSVNGELFFSAFDPTNGLELWKSDGTAAGTQLVKDIRAGSTGSNPASLTNVNGTLFFAADNGIDGVSLWKSDGTAVGTVEVKGALLGVNSNPQNLVSINGTLFFTADDGVHGRELWKSDGTAAGTVLVKDINPTGPSSNPFGLTNINGTLFFEANDGVHGVELWKSDGTAAGTVLVKDINPGIADGFASNIINVNGSAFFGAETPATGFELWKSDGTAAGTVPVTELVPGVGSDGIESLTNVDGILEFTAFDVIRQVFGLFRSDGTAAGTFEIAGNIDDTIGIGFSQPATIDDFNGVGRGGVLWRGADGGLIGWGMDGGDITSSTPLTFGGKLVRPDASFSVAGTTDFNGDGKADVLWRSTDGTLVDWTMDGTNITSSRVLTFNGSAVKPDASFQIAGVGDFNGDTRSDILWRAADGTLIDWTMNRAVVTSSDVVTANGAAVRPDAGFSVAGIGDFNGDLRRDVLWRSTSGQVVEWQMNGSNIESSGDITFAGAAVRPDSSFSVAGIGDFDHDGNSDILWRSASGELDGWLMKGTAIGSSAAIMFNGQIVRPDASFHIIEVADFNGDDNADILWRSDSGALAEWLMNGTTISQSLTPNSNGTAVSVDASFSPQAKPTNFG